MAEAVVAERRRDMAGMVALGLGTAVVAIGAVMARNLPSRWEPNWPFVVVVVCVSLVIALITVVRLHAFMALILAALAAGLMTAPSQLPPIPGKAFFPAERAMELTAIAFGATAGGIGIVIGLAAIIGMAILESGAADKIVRRSLHIFGEKHAGLALLVATYIISSPIFFDTIFMLLVPLAKALRMRTGKNYLLYVMAICCAGVVTHSMIVPHPGPLAMVDALKVDVGLTIIAGMVSGVVPVAAGWLASLVIARFLLVDLVETPGTPLKDLEAIMDRPESELPSFFMSILPIVLPVLLITIHSALTTFGGASRFGALYAWTGFLGNRNIALFIAALVAITLLVRQRGLRMRDVADRIGPPLETAGVIILITAAGGAFGLMLKNAGVGDAITAAAKGASVNLLLLGWGVAFILRVAQGSATVAMLTTSAMLAPVLGDLPCHPVYLFLAIGYGAFACSWMNDSGFWVVSRLGGLTEKQMLKSWTVVLTVMGVVGLLTTLLSAKLLPFK